MDNDLLCTWLKLPAGCWPPDHYALLGLTPGERDARAIEARVHERMEILRRYQLANPDLATEAMNRLAQAMICLSDDRSRETYHAQHFPQLLPPPASPDPLSVPAAPEANRAPAPQAIQPSAAAPTSAPALVQTPADTKVHTRRDLYYRIARTRQIEHSWAQIGNYLENPRRRLTGPSEAVDLIQHMQALPRLIASFPFRFGQAGAPGYLVLALARQQLIVPTLQTLLPSQRVALARDWENGRAFLTEQKAQLREQIDIHRRRSGWDHLVRLTRSILNNHPGLAVLTATLVALNWRFDEVRHKWPLQIAGLVLLAMLNLCIWWAKSRYTRVHLPERPARSGPGRRGKRRAVPTPGPER
jgi:hypothetical protein